MTGQPEPQRRRRSARVCGGCGSSRALSQRDLSSPGITYAYISRIEAGARTPSVKALRMLAKKLGVTPEYLETGSELDAAELRELRLAEQELRLRLDGDADTAALHELLDGGGGLRRRRRGDARADRARASRRRHAATTRGTIEHLAGVVDSELVTPVSRPDVYSTLGRAYAASGLAARGGRPLRAGARGARPRRARESRGAGPLQHLPQLRAHRPRRAPARDAPSSPSCSPARTARPTATRRCASTGRSAGSRSSRRGRSRRSTTSAARSPCSRRPRTPCTSPAPTSPAPRRRSRAGDDLAGASHHLERGRAAARPAAAPTTTSPSSAGCRRSCASADRRLRAAPSTSAERGARCSPASSRTSRAAPGGRSPRRAPRAGDAARRRRLPRGGRAARSATASVREHAGVLRAYGRYLREQGREREALDVFERAAEVAANLQAEPASAER